MGPHRQELKRPQLCSLARNSLLGARNVWFQGVLPGKGSRCSRPSFLWGLFPWILPMLIKQWARSQARLHTLPVILPIIATRLQSICLSVQRKKEKKNPQGVCTKGRGRARGCPDCPEQVQEAVRHRWAGAR